MAQLTDIVRENTGIEWAFFGFKQSDSLNRRVMLRTYESEAINEKSKKCYPLSAYKNSDVLDYIARRGLITPERYGTAQSQGCNITDLDYLLYLRDKFPADLSKVVAEYPDVERILFEYDYTKSNESNSAE
jgi:sulfate adenylyltransferase subunit 2